MFAKDWEEQSGFSMLRIKLLELHRRRTSVKG